MIDWLREYWYLIIVFILSLFLCEFIFMKASKAYSSHRKSYADEEKEIKRLIALKETFSGFQREKILSAEKETVLEGTALIIQLYLQKKENIEDEFNSLNDVQKNIYTLDVFCTDGSLKEFFSKNDKILKDRFIPSLEMIGLEDNIKIISHIEKMYDDSEEEVSYSEEEITKADNLLLDMNFLRKIKLQSADYIIENLEELALKQK